MKKLVRYLLCGAGFVTGIYGALRDIEPLTVLGAFILVGAIMYPFIIAIFQSKD